MDATVNDFLTKLTESNQQAMQSALKFGEIATRAQGRVMRHQMAALESWVEAGTNLSAKGGNDPADVLAKRVELGELFSTLMRESLEIHTDVQGEFTKWVDDGWKTMNAMGTPPRATAKAKV